MLKNESISFREDPASMGPGVAFIGAAEASEPLNEPRPSRPRGEPALWAASGDGPAGDSSDELEAEEDELDEDEDADDDDDDDEEPGQ